MISSYQFRVIGSLLVGLAIILAIGLLAYLASETRIVEDQVPTKAAAEVPISMPSREKEEVNSRLSIRDGSLVQEIDASAATVGLALRDAGIKIRYIDKVEPRLDMRLENIDAITITRALSYTVHSDGQTLDLLTHLTKTLDVLAASGVALVGADYTDPPLDSTLYPGQDINVIRVREETVSEEVAVPFVTVWQGTDTLELDQRGLLTSGTPGTLLKSQVVRFENGQEVSRSAAQESMLVDPVNEVMGYGTRINIRTMNTEAGPIEFWRVVRMRVTAYTPSSAGKPPDHPGYGITASGLPAGKGVVAVDPKVVPFRSRVYVPGYGIAVAGDTGGGVKGRFIDLGYPDGEIESWNGYVDVYYLTPVPPPDEINYLIPEGLP